MIIENAVHSDLLFLSSPKIKDGMLEFLKGQPVSKGRGAADEVYAASEGTVDFVLKVLSHSHRALARWSACKSQGTVEMGFIYLITCTDLIVSTQR
jgi:hypothetical protein